MTQEHRDLFLAMDGWQETERGYIRVNEYFDVHDTMPVPRVMRFYVRANMHQTHRKFRRFPFGRKPKHDPLVGWFATDAKIRRGTRTATLKSGREIEVDNWDDSDPRGTPRPELREIAYRWLYTARNKRQGWDKYGEVMG